MVSENPIDPFQHWVRRLNNSEVQDCIFDITNNILVAIMKK